MISVILSSILLVIHSPLKSQVLASPPFSPQIFTFDFIFKDSIISQHVSNRNSQVISLNPQRRIFLMCFATILSPERSLQPDLIPTQHRISTFMPIGTYLLGQDYIRQRSSIVRMLIILLLYWSSDRPMYIRIRHGDVTVAPQNILFHSVVNLCLGGCDYDVLGVLTSITAQKPWMEVVRLVQNYGSKLIFPNFRSSGINIFYLNIHWSFRQFTGFVLRAKFRFEDQNVQIKKIALILSIHFGHVSGGNFINSLLNKQTHEVGTLKPCL